MRRAVSANRVLFIGSLTVLFVLLAAMIVLATGSREGSEGIGVLARTLVGAGVVVLIIGLVRRFFSR